MIKKVTIQIFYNIHQLITNIPITKKAIHLIINKENSQCQ